MTTDIYSEQDLLKYLENIIDADELIYQSLIFFSQDEADVSDLPASSIIDKVKSIEHYKEYEFLKIVFEEINQQIGSHSSQKCCTIVTRLSGELKDACYTPGNQPSAPLHTPTDPEELSDDFLFKEFPKKIDIDYLRYFAISGLKMPQTEYNNVVRDLKYPDKTRAVLHWWKGTQEGKRYRDPPPSYTITGLIAALERVELSCVKKWVKENTHHTC